MKVYLNIFGLRLPPMLIPRGMRYFEQSTKPQFAEPSTARVPFVRTSRTTWLLYNSTVRCFRTNHLTPGTSKQPVGLLVL